MNDSILEVSKATGVHSNTLYSIRAGRSVTTATLAKIEAYYNRPDVAQVIADLMLASNGFLMRDTAQKMTRKEIINYVGLLEPSESAFDDVGSAIMYGRFPLDTIEALFNKINVGIK